MPDSESGKGGGMGTGLALGAALRPRRHDGLRLPVKLIRAEENAADRFFGTAVRQ